jgi:hypothetical protein
MKSRDTRFAELRSLASESDEAAIHDLWLEFQFDARAEADHELPRREEDKKNNKQKEP